MASRQEGRARQGLVVLSVLVTALLLASCGGNSGVHTQTPTAGPSTSSSTTLTFPTAPASSTPASSTGTVKPIPTPTVVPAAQGAVNAYISFYNAMNAADADPAHADMAKINSYLMGKALSLFDGVITSQAKAGLAYRGTPEQPRLKVGEVITPSFLFLTSCPLASTSDPFVQYNVKTGKAVPVSEPSVPPPWKRTIAMKKVGGAWKVSDLLVDSSKTCAA